MRRTNFFSTWSFAAIFFALTTPSLAQRGEPSSFEPSKFTNPSQGFPGFFDSNFAEKGSLAVEWPPLILPLLPMPSIEVDYGVTETLTVGTNAIITTLPWLFGAQGLSLKVRTLVYGSEDFVSAGTVYGGYLSKGGFSTSWEMFTSNNSWHIAPNHILTGQLMAINFGLQNSTDSSTDYSNLRLSSIGLGGGYQYILSKNLALNINGLAPAWTSIEADTIADSLNANLNSSTGQFLWGIARGSVDIRSDKWLYSIGGLYVQGLSASVLPWASAARVW